MEVVRYERRSRVAVLTVDYPPVNALSAAVRAGLADAVARATADDGVDALLIVGAGRGFIAGADLSEFGTEKPALPPQTKDIHAALEASGKLTVAAIHGHALGGGLEMALVCDCRIAVGDAKFGLPEVKLGILPGGGGTQRLTRLVGPAAAAEIMLSGRSLSAREALGAGLVDAIVDDVGEAAIRFVRAALDTGRRFPPVLAREEHVRSVDPALIEALRSGARRQARGAVAPVAIVDCIEAACMRPAAEGLAYEKERYRQLYAHAQREAMVHGFFAERQARRLPPGFEDGRARGVSTVAIVGQGARARMLSCEFAGTAAEVAKADLVVVLAPVMPVEVAALAATLKTGAVLAVEVGDIDLDRFARAAAGRVDMVGIDFGAAFEGARLLELVVDAASSADAVATVAAHARSTGRLTVIARGRSIGRSLLGRYRSEIGKLVAEQVPPDRIDGALRAFGMAEALVASPARPTDSVPDMAIVDRIMGAVAAEGALLLGDGTAARPGDIDLVWVHGYGFPAHEGGPLYWAARRLEPPVTPLAMESAA